MATFVCATPGRRLLGLVLLLAGLVLIGVGAPLDWGVAVTAVVPGLFLLVPALGLLRQRVLRCDGVRLWIDDRGPLTPAGWRLELVPTAGLRAIVLHPPDAVTQQAEPGVAGDTDQPPDEVVVATWLFPGRAEELVRWLESRLKCRLERVVGERHRLDR